MYKDYQIQKNVYAVFFWNERFTPKQWHLYEVAKIRFLMQKK